jgi:hypothetical protein
MPVQIAKAVLKHNRSSSLDAHLLNFEPYVIQPRSGKT